MPAHADELIEDIRRGTINPDYLPEGAPPVLATRARAEPAPRRRARRASCARPASCSRARCGRTCACSRAGRAGRCRSTCASCRTLLRRRARARPRLHGERGPRRDAARQLGRRRRAERDRATSSSSCPRSSATTRTPEFLTGDQLESNREYYIYFTTSAGLYRYDINDVIRVVDFYRNTPVVQFVRKGQGMTSITGEKLTESQVTGALVEVVDSTGFDVAALHGRGRVGRAAALRPLRRARRRDDDRRTRASCSGASTTRSRRANIEYEAKRESQRLGAPVLRRVAPGTYQALRQKRVAEGAPEAQVKIPQLSHEHGVRRRS